MHYSIYDFANHKALKRNLFYLNDEDEIPYCNGIWLYEKHLVMARAMIHFLKQWHVKPSYLKVDDELFLIKLDYSSVEVDVFIEFFSVFYREYCRVFIDGQPDSTKLMIIGYFDYSAFALEECQARAYDKPTPPWRFDK